MSTAGPRLAQSWMRLAPQFLPFADAATPELPLRRLLRLSLFQISVGLSISLLIGTLNRVMIVELHVSTALVGLMVALPLAFAPLRALIGFRSDTHRSFLGWKRVPYLWFGTLLQFGGLAIMPFALILLSGDTHGPAVYGLVGSGLAFLLVGAGLHTTQTVGLALATDLSPEATQPRVVALMCTMLLVGVAASALVFGALLADFTQLRLIQVIQGTAALSFVLNLAALWKQEPRDASRTAPDRARPSFGESWSALNRDARAPRRLFALGLGTVAFSMQDILLEPYGGEVLGLSVAQTTLLTAVWAGFGIAGFIAAARAIRGGSDCYRIAGLGVLAGVFGLAAVVFSAPAQATWLFVLGVAIVGAGGGLFAHATLTAAMRQAPAGQIGLAIGAWGAVQATAAGAAVAASGLLHKAVAGLAQSGQLGATLSGPATGYGVVYYLEIGLLFATLVAIGPLVRSAAIAVPVSTRDPTLSDLSFRPLSPEISP